MKRVSFTVGVRADASPIMVEHLLDATGVDHPQDSRVAKTRAVVKKNRRYSSKKMQCNCKASKR